MHRIGHWLSAMALVAGYAATGFALEDVKPSWTSLSQKNICEAGRPLQCKGHYGFSVYPDGSYQVGPGPEGQLVEGVVNSQEQQELVAAAAKVFAKVTRTRILRNQRHLDNTSVAIKMALASGDVTIYRWNGDRGSIFYSGEQADAFALEALMRQLVNKYYPKPFPSGT